MSGSISCTAASAAAARPGEYSYAPETAIGAKHRREERAPYPHPVMKVTMLLCDAAEEVGGKLYILGGGWSFLHRPGVPTNMALAIKIAVPWNETNQSHTLRAHLLTDDGEP